MSRGKPKRKPKHIEELPMALALILSKIPPALPSKKQAEANAKALYKDRAELDHSDLC